MRRGLGLTCSPETELALRSSGEMTEADIRSILDYVRFVKERKEKSSGGG